MAQKKPAKRENLVHTAVRLPSATIAGIDDLIDRIHESNPAGRQWSRSDVMQECLAYGLKHWNAFGSPIADATADAA